MIKEVLKLMFELSLAIGPLAYIWYAYDWKLSLALLCFAWFHNIEQHGEKRG